MSKIKHLDCDKVFECLKSALNQACSIDYKDVKSLTWDGPLLTTFRVLACSFNTNEALGEFFEGSIERGHTAVDLILYEAFKFGQEHAYRTLAIERENSVHFKIIRKGLEENPSEEDRKMALTFLELLENGYSNPGGVT